MNEVTVIQNKEMTAPEVRDRVNLIQTIMQSVMKKDTHYGTIPGTKKDSLYKAGAEVICMTFKIAQEYRVEDLSTPDEARYRVTCTGRHQMTGIALGEGMGECSSNEEKYSYRAAVCHEEFDATPESKRRTKWSKGYKGEKPYSVNQVKTNVADVANTVLKMACKRAMVAMTLNTTAASDIFTQDLEDFPDELREFVKGDKPDTQEKSSEYLAFETAHLQNMRDSSLDGLPALTAAFNALPAGALKTAFWKEYGDSLKKAASASPVIEG
jgi:cytochrome c556